MNLTFKIICLLWIFSTSINCAKIVVLQPLGSKSYKNTFRPVIHELAARGHDVTWIVSFPEQKLVPNLREIVIHENGRLLENDENQDAMFENGINKDPLQHFQFLLQMMVNSTKNYLDHPQIESLMQKGMQYDVAIITAVLNDISLMTAAALAKRIVSFNPAHFALPSKSSPPLPLSTVRLSPSPHEISFLQRVTNGAVATAVWVYFTVYSQDTITAIGQEKYPNLPSVSQVMDRVDLNLINADPVMAEATPSLPHFVRIGGINCKPSQPLSKKFSDFIESSGDEGFIFFSLGSIVQAKNMPENIRLEFLKAFSRLKQKVIWKFEVEMPNIPSNVMITPWAPQQDLLGHPKIRLFFTHGGILSCQEAIYHGVPVLGLAVFGDQPMNVFRLTELGIGIGLEISNLSADIIQEKIEHVIRTPSFKIKMKKYSDILRDQILAENPLEKAVFWIEYILRYKTDDYLITPAVHLENYQYLSLDIISVIILFSLFIIWIITMILKYLISKVKKVK